MAERENAEQVIAEALYRAFEEKNGAASVDNIIWRAQQDHAAVAVAALREAGLLVEPGQVAVSLPIGGEIITEYAAEQTMCLSGGQPFKTMNPMPEDLATHARLVFPWVPVSEESKT